MTSRYADGVSTFEIIIDPTSPTGLVDQLREQIQDAVKSGTLAAGSKLPTVRALATRLEVAPYTVARAYRQLEDLGVVETHGRNGTIISTFGDTTQQQAQLAAREFADRMHGLKVASADALALAKAALG